MYSVSPVHTPVVSSLELYGYLFTYVYLCFAFQLSVFLNRLTSQPIGLTAMGLFVLDKPTIITVRL